MNHRYILVSTDAYDHTQAISVESFRSEQQMREINHAAEIDYYHRRLAAGYFYSYTIYEYVDGVTRIIGADAVPEKKKIIINEKAKEAYTKKTTKVKAQPGTVDWLTMQLNERARIDEGAPALRIHQPADPIARRPRPQIEDEQF